MDAIVSFGVYTIKCTLRGIYRKTQNILQRQWVPQSVLVQEVGPSFGIGMQHNQDKASTHDEQAYLHSDMEFVTQKATT